MSNTLEYLENDNWGDPEFDSHLVTTCHQLRRKPIDQFSVEDLRIMIGQNIGLKYLIPKAMIILSSQPLKSGDFFDADLLKAVICCDWIKTSTDSKINAELLELCKAAMVQLEHIEATSIIWADSPEKYGLSNQDADDAIRSIVDELKTNSPYRDFAKFCIDAENS